MHPSSLAERSRVATFAAASQLSRLGAAPLGSNESAMREGSRALVWLAEPKHEHASPHGFMSAARRVCGHDAARLPSTAPLPRRSRVDATTSVAGKPTPVTSSSLHGTVESFTGLRRFAPYPQARPGVPERNGARVPTRPSAADVCPEAHRLQPRAHG